MPTIFTTRLISNFLDLRVLIVSLAFLTYFSLSTRFLFIHASLVFLRQKRLLSYHGLATDSRLNITSLGVFQIHKPDVIYVARYRSRISQRSLRCICVYMLYAEFSDRFASSSNNFLYFDKFLRNFFLNF